MCSSRVDADGRVVITAPGGEAGYEVGRAFWPVGFYAPEALLAEQRFFADWLARSTLSQQGRAWGEGIKVQPPEGELERLVGAA